MNAQEVSLVQLSFARTQETGDRLTPLIYEELFAIAPSLRDRFPADADVQRHRLQAVLSLIVGQLPQSQAMTHMLRGLATKHLRYDVEPLHYTYFGNALLRALKKCLGEEFTPEARSAWISAFVIVANAMKEAAYANPRRKPVKLRLVSRTDGVPL